MITYKELDERIHKFIEIYGEGYDRSMTEDEREYLEMSLSNYILSSYRAAYHDFGIGETVFSQIFSAIDALPKEKNPYFQMANRIEEEYGLDKNIVEVGGGRFPALAYEIQKRQAKLHKGSITVYDPALAVLELEGIQLVKKPFSSATPLLKTDLVVGQKPCKATESIIRVANKNSIPFYIELCSCDHTPGTQIYPMIPFENKWQWYVEKVTRDTLPSYLEVEKSTTKDALSGEELAVVKTKRRDR